MPLYLSPTMLWLSSDPLLYFVLSLTLKPGALPFLSSVLERQQSQLPLGGRLWLGGLAQAEWLIGNVFFVFLFFFCWTAMRRQLIFFLIYLFIFNLICISRALPTHPLSCARSQAQTHTFSHMKRVREGEMLDQTDSFGLGKKDSSYL